MSPMERIPYSPITGRPKIGSGRIRERMWDYLIDGDPEGG